jgi:hypothetical protein
MEQSRTALTPNLAALLKRDKIKELSSAEERERFWRRALSDEQEQALWQQMMLSKGITQLTPGAPETLAMGLEISKQVYPDRHDMAPGEGRTTEAQQAEWAARHARRGPPKPKVEQAPAPADGQSSSTNVWTMTPGVAAPQEQPTGEAY